MFDAIVVGGRCAGAATAMLLARAGWRVLILERAELPSDTLSTHYVHAPGTALLAHWGLLEQLAATGCPAITRQVLTAPGVMLRGDTPSIDGARPYAPRRYILDGVLVDAAVAAGAELRHNCTVTELVEDGDRVVGVRCRSASGRVDTIPAHLVIGADGTRSTVARLVHAAEFRARPTLTCTYYSYWSGVPGTELELSLQPGSFIAAFPTHGELTLVEAYFPIQEFPSVRRRALDAFLGAVLDANPDLFALLHEGNREERLYGTGTQPNAFRQACGPGWALVGDAGHHKDSITAWGISDAFRQAHDLAALLAPVTPDDRGAIDHALGSFTALRDSRMDHYYESTMAMATLDPTPVLPMLHSAQGDQRLADQYFQFIGGALPPRRPRAATPLPQRQ